MIIEVIYPLDQELDPKFGKTRIYEYEVPEYILEVVTPGDDDVILSHIYREFNHVDGTEYISIAAIQDRSMSIGDMIEFPEGKVYMVAPIGWREVNKDERAKIEAMDFRKRQDWACP
jgi:hypothetical protein